MSHPVIPNLPGLLRRLREEDGLPAGIDRHIAVATLLRRLEKSGKYLKDPVEAADLLSPILATNPREQLAVLRCIFELAPEATTIAAAPTGGRAVPIGLQEEAGKAAKQERSRGGAYVIAGAATMFVLAALLYYLAPVGDGFGPAASDTELGMIGGLSSAGLTPAMVAALITYIVVLRLLPAPMPGRRPDPSALTRAWETPDADRSHLLRPGRLRGALRGLRNRLVQDRRQLDLPASIHATAKAGGPPHLVLDQRTPVPAYLLLAEVRDRRDHAGLMPDVLIRRLRNALLRLDAYASGNDPATAQPWDQRRSAPMPLTRLLPRHAGQRLLLVSDGGPWWDPLADSLTPEAAPLLRLQPRILLTPVLRAAWGAREACFIRSGFAVVELTPGGLDSLARWLESPRENPTPEHLPGVRQRDIAQELELHGALLVSERPPAPAQIIQLRDQLAIWLGPAGWQLLAAIALHPRPGAGLTARLASRLAREKLAHEVMPLRMDEATVSRVARLPWLRRGRMPGWLRQELAPGLAPELRGPVADAYLRFMTGLDAAPFRMDAEERAKLLDRARSVPVPASLAADQQLMAFLETECMTADLPWRDLLARWARACAAPVAALAAAAVIWAIWQRFGGMISLISAVDWFRGPSQEAGRLPPWSTWGGWPWLPLLLAVPAVASATWFRWWPGFGLMCGLGAGLIAGAFELATSIQAVALGSVLAGAVTLLPASNAAYAWDLRTVGLARPICSSVAVAALLQVIAPNLLELRAETLLGLALALGVLGLAGMGAALVDRPTAQADWLRPILVFAGCGLVFAGMTELLIRILYSARPYIPFGGDSALIGGLLAAMLARIVPFTKNLFIRLIALTVLLQIMFFVFEHDGMLKFSIGGSQLEVSSIILPLRMLVLCANFPFVSKRYFLTCFIFMFLLKFSITFSLLASDISKSVVPQSSAVGFVAEYAAVILMTRPKPQTRQLWTWAALRPWFASLPLLACSLHFFFGNALFILPWLAIPVAAWLVQRYGAAALTPIAVMLAPMLVGFSTGWFGTAGNPGLFLTALLTARLVHDAALRESVMAAAAPLATGHVWLLLFTLPCVVAISVFAGITVGTWLWTLMLALLVLIGLSRVPLAPLRRPVFLAFGFGTAFLMVRTAVGINPLTPTINLGFAFQTPADLLAVALALWGTRALRTEMQSDPKEIQTRNLRGMALLLFLAAIILEPVRLSLLRTQLDLVGHASVLLLSLALGMLPHPQHGKRDWVTTGTLVLLYAVPLLLLAIALPRGMDLWVVTITPNNILGTVCGAAETAAFTVFGRRLGPYFSQQRVGRAATPPPSSRQFAALLGAVREDARRIAVITAVAIMIGTLIVPLLGQDKNNAATAPQESGTSGASSSKF